MLDLAVAGEPGLAVDRRELRRDGRSYSIDTLLELRAELGGDAPVALLVGADSFVGLPDWHRWRELFDHAHFVVAQRPGSPLDRDLRPELAATLDGRWRRSEEHTSELQSLMRISYAVFCLKKKHKKD